MMGFAFLIPILVIALVAYLVFQFFQENQTYFKNSGSTQNPIEILEIRYARGEINKQEFDQMRDDLS